MGKGTRFECRECGSSAVLFDAYVTWDEVFQAMQIVNVFDDARCDECDGECAYDEFEMENTEIVSEGKEETRKLLLQHGFTRSPNSYFSSYSGEFKPDIERWNNQITKPKEPAALKRFEGVNPTDAGFEVIFDHGRLAETSVLRFPRYGTEPDYWGAFERLMLFIVTHYEFEPGMPGFMFGD